jgi:hypothetical protein
MEIKSILGEKVLIEWRKMESLQPDNLKMPYNIGHLKKSLLENNFAMPFFGWQNGESVFVIDGHQRREVLSELESEGVKVPELLDCQLINAKDRQQAIKLLLSVFNSKSNPIDLEVLTEWVETEEVEIEITSLNVVDVNDVQEEIQEILEAEEDDFDSTPPETHETVLGDLYEIGEHRLLCGDSTDSDAVANLMNGSKADMVFTDPMYQDSPLPIISIFNTLETNYFLIMATFKQCMSFVNDSGFRFRFDLVFNQKVPSSTMNKKVPYYLHKNLIYLTKDDSTIFDCDNAKGFFSDAGYYPSIIESAKNTSEVHGLTKNSDGIVKILSGFRCKSILDLFIGSGTTMVASHQLKRKCYGMELDPKYCDVIIKRMIKLDSNLKVKRNGIDETKKWLDKIK